MDCLTIFPLIVGAIGNVSAGALVALAERLLTILVAVFLIGGISVFALTAFAWLWVRHVFDEPQAATAFDGARSAAPSRRIITR